MQSAILKRFRNVMDDKNRTLTFRGKTFSLATLELFEEWKEEAGGLNNKYMTRESYEDLK